MIDKLIHYAIINIERLLWSAKRTTVVVRRN